MSRIGMSLDQLLVATWSSATRPAYAARIAGLNVLRGETIALVGEGAAALLDELTDALPRCTVIDGDNAAQAGTLRIHAQQAARVGVQSLAITEPFRAVGEAGRALAVADLAGLAGLGVTTVVATDDVGLAAAFADRVAVLRDGQVVVAYPVLAPAPRMAGDIDPVSQRVTARLRSAS